MISSYDLISMRCWSVAHNAIIIGEWHLPFNDETYDLHEIMERDRSFHVRNGLPVN